MNQLLTKSSLTPASAHLIELMQAVNFGRIEELLIRGGQPVFDPAPRVIQKVKIGADNSPRPEASFADFRLKGAISELLVLLIRIKDGEVRSIEVRCGLPVSAEIDWGPEVSGISGSSQSFGVLTDKPRVFMWSSTVSTELLARVVNRLQAKLKNTTADIDVTERRWLYVDCDPKRPAGISSTDEEHHAALQRITQIRRFLTARGWPEPIEANSGNGRHLLYRLPPMDLVRAGQLVAACLKALAARFSGAAVEVDQATATAARIRKLYGTMTRKGDAATDRPHRRSRILDEPERIETVLVEALEALAKEAEPAGPLSTENHNISKLGRFDIQEWLLKGGLEVVKGPETYEGALRGRWGHARLIPNTTSL